MCGEKLHFVQEIASNMGSPPRVRGEVQLLHDRVKQLRITPACAGRSNIISIDMSMNWDHPRVRGEKQTHIFSRIRSQGSPPRARGEVARPVAPLKNRGITPACAGRRGRAMRCFYTSRDHPRVCGEKLTGKNGAQTEKGSPPRVRGEAGEPAFPAFHLRITPRVCGEKAVVNPKRQSGKDHPPRVRGEGETGENEGEDERITPACAGRSLNRGFCRGRSKDHPRVCGEKLYRIASASAIRGSPPRVRGEEAFRWT